MRPRGHHATAGQGDGLLLPQSDRARGRRRPAPGGQRVAVLGFRRSSWEWHRSHPRWPGRLPFLFDPPVSPDIRAPVRATAPIVATIPSPRIRRAADHMAELARSGGRLSWATSPTLVLGPAGIRRLRARPRSRLDRWERRDFAELGRGRIRPISLSRHNWEGRLPRRVAHNCSTPSSQRLGQAPEGWPHAVGRRVAARPDPDPPHDNWPGDKRRPLRTIDAGYRRLR